MKQIDQRLDLTIRAGLITLFAALVFGSASSAHAQRTIAYIDATIETVGAEGRIEQGTLIVRDGKIAAVGHEIEIPADAERVSMAGKTLMPGLIDPYLVFQKRPEPEQQAGPPQRRGRRLRGAPAARFTAGPFIRIGEFFYPWETDFSPAVRSGITVAQLVTDGRGQSALARLHEDVSDQMLIDHPGFLFAKVTNQTGALDIIRNGLDPEAASSGRGRGRRGRSGGRRAADDSSSNNGDEKDDEAEENEDDEELKALWTEVREGQKPLVVNVNNAATVAHVLKLMARFDKVQLHLVSTGPNLYQSLDEISEHNVSVILQPGIDEVPFTTQRMNVARMIDELEIPFALSISLNEAQMKASQDDSLFPVSVLVKTGLPRQAAFEALTIRPARMLGIEATHGSLEPGKSADFLVFDGDPLATTGRLERVISQGRTIYEN